MSAGSVLAKGRDPADTAPPFSQQCYALFIIEECIYNFVLISRKLSFFHFGSALVHLLECFHGALICYLLRAYGPHAAEAKMYPDLAWGLQPRCFQLDFMQQILWNDVGVKKTNCAPFFAASSTP
ncbi:hypothetical protein LSM04_001731 [Trypanosoma melophagium]|uniref:uncharacterized protein n=1 Tax=Trypanosoma melophagium TaxID=715481 RepID=UPI00351A2D0A|nr:hypothetical protein LSM04_001731 [Trypanosoma melophagium]